MQQKKSITLTSGYAQSKDACEASVECQAPCNHEQTLAIVIMTRHCLNVLLIV